MLLQLKGVFSPHLNEPNLPDDPECCFVLMFADIGQRGSAGADQFNFHVVTPRYLSENPEVRWGRAYLLMPAFSWSEVTRMLERLVANTNAQDWRGAAK
jgi:hypothetical protein